jgi:hypothetical protein
MTLPRDFLDEVETELARVRASFVEGRARIEALEDLRLLAAHVAEQLDRPITVFDVVGSTRDRQERERRIALVRCLRSPPGAG